MLLELTLLKDDKDFGPKGSKVMISDSYVVGVTNNPNGRGSKLFVDMSDLETFKTLFVKESYEKWHLLRLNA